jgi:tRNA-2-methylthio-N6-dimethylallyladenosine synthase
VLAEVRELARQGYQEIMLLGQNVNAYGKDFVGRTYTFAQLLDDIRKIAIPRVRFTTSHPRDFDDALIDVLAKGGNLVEHIHLPVQSGSNAVLKQMARKYTREHFIELVQKIRQAIPQVVLTTDIIVGFPGETEEQFEETVDLVKEVGFEGAYTFIYSPREGTPAFDMIDDVEEPVKKARLHRLNQELGTLSFKGLEKLINETVEVYVEGTSARNARVLAGRTRTNKLVHFVGSLDLVGQLVYVTITGHNSWALNGVLVNHVKDQE